MFYVLMSITVGLILTFIYGMNRQTELETAYLVGLPFGFIVSAASALSWLVYSIRCRVCGNRPVWGILRTASASEWFVKLYALERCPSCGSMR